MTPPLEGSSADAIADAADNFVQKSRGLACDGYIVYDIQEEAGRTADARPFPFRKLDDPGAFAAALRKASGGTESVVYKCVAETKSEGEFPVSYIHLTLPTNREVWIWGGAALMNKKTQA